jgi:two-component system sensor histidine kinase KdpD
MEEDLGKLHQIQDSTTASFEADAKETGVAQWVFINGLAAGKGTSTLPGSRAMYLPLSTAGGRIGVIGLLASVPDRVFEPEEMHLLEMFTNQMALAVERAVLSKEAAKSPVAAAQTDSDKTT